MSDRQAFDHANGEVLAYVLSHHRDSAFLKLQALLELFGIMQFYTDGWGAYEQHLHPAFHMIGQANTQINNLPYLFGIKLGIKSVKTHNQCFLKHQIYQCAYSLTEIIPVTVLTFLLNTQCTT